MALPKAQIKALLDELGKINGGKTIAKALNELIFRPSDEEVAMMNPQLQQAMMAKAQQGQPGQGMGQPPNAPGNGQMAGPGGV